MMTCAGSYCLRCLFITSHTYASLQGRVIPARVGCTQRQIRRKIYVLATLSRYTEASHNVGSLSSTRSRFFQTRDDHVTMIRFPHTIEVSLWVRSIGRSYEARQGDILHYALASFSLQNVQFAATTLTLPEITISWWQSQRTAASSPLDFDFLFRTRGPNHASSYASQPETSMKRQHPSLQDRHHSSPYRQRLRLESSPPPSRLLRHDLPP